MAHFDLAGCPLVRGCLALGTLAALPSLAGCTNARAQVREPAASSISAGPASGAPAASVPGLESTFSTSMRTLEQRALRQAETRWRKDTTPEPDRPSRTPQRKSRPSTEGAARPLSEPLAPTNSEQEFQAQLAHQSSQEQARLEAEAKAARVAAEEARKTDRANQVYFPWKGGWAYTNARSQKVIHEPRTRPASPARSETESANAALSKEGN